MKSKIQYKWIWLFLLAGALLLPSTVLAESKAAKVKPQKSEKKNPEKESSGKKPDLQFLKTKYDFGTIYKGANVDHKFEFTNKGDGVLEIGKVKTSCGCTAALTSSKTIKAGESGTIKTTFRSKNFRGRITKTIYVHSNDPDEGVIQLVLKGTILEEVTLDPRRLTFNMVDKGSEAKKYFHIRQVGKKQLKILEVKSNLDYVVAKVESVDKIFDMNLGDKFDYEMEVKIAKDAPPGRFNGILTIKTNIPKQAEIKYQVNGIIR